MADAIQFYADQHYPAPVTDGLCRRVIEVLTAREAGMCGASDADQLAFARNHGRVVLTFDSDFLVLHESGIQHLGIVWCPATKYGIGDLIKALVLLHGVFASDELRNSVEYL